MENDAFEKYDELREFAWLQSHWHLMAWRLRPLTIGSIILARQMGLILPLNGGKIEGFHATRISKEIRAIIWMQTEEIGDVLESVRSGKWQLLDLEAYALQGLGSQCSEEELAHEVLMYLDTQWQLAEAARYKPTGGKKIHETQFPPNWVAAFVHNITTVIPSASLDYILWELPYCQAVQIEHRAMKEKGWKTIKPGERVDAQRQIEKAEQAAQMATQVNEDDW